MCMLLALGFSFAALAQSHYRLTFKGTCSTMDSSGQSVSKSITDKSLVREWAGYVGVTNTKNLVLAFHPNVDWRGDAIEVVDARTGAHVNTVFPLFFPETATSVRPRLISEKRFAYVYNLRQSEFSRGTAVLSEQIMIDQRGRTNRFVASGQLQWYQLPEGTNALRFFSGTFTVGKKLK